MSYEQAMTPSQTEVNKENKDKSSFPGLDSMLSERFGGDSEKAGKILMILDEVLNTVGGTLPKVLSGIFNDARTTDAEKTAIIDQIAQIEEIDYKSSWDNIQASKKKNKEWVIQMDETIGALVERLRS